MQSPDIINNIIPLKIQEVFLNNINYYTHETILPLHQTHISRDDKSFYNVKTFSKASAYWVCRSIGKFCESVPDENDIFKFYFNALKVSRVTEETQTILQKNCLTYILVIFLLLGDVGMSSLENFLNKQVLEHELFQINKSTSSWSQAKHSTVYLEILKFLKEIKEQIESQLLDKDGYEACLKCIMDVYIGLKNMLFFNLNDSINELTKNLRIQSFIYPYRFRLLLINLLEKPIRDKCKDLLLNCHTPKLYFNHEDLKKRTVRPEVFLNLLDNHLPEKIEPREGIKKLIKELDEFRNTFWVLSSKTLQREQPSNPTEIQKCFLNRPSLKGLNPQLFTYLELLKQKLSLMYTQKWEWVWMLKHKQWHSRHPEVINRVRILKQKNYKDVYEIQDLRGLLVLLFSL